jgi:hypothetical protein
LTIQQGMHTMTKTDPRPECGASFQTPDGQRYYCQHRGRAGHAGRHIYNVIRHAVTWTGTAGQREPDAHACGYEKCPGGAARVEVKDFDPAQNDATREGVPA